MREHTGESIGGTLGTQKRNMNANGGNIREHGGWSSWGWVQQTNGAVLYILAPGHLLFGPESSRGVTTGKMDVSKTDAVRHTHIYKL